MKLTDYLAIYAAVLSTAVFVWNVVQARPRLRVDVIFGIEEIDGVVQGGVCLCVRNVSSKEVHLAQLSVLYPYKAATLKARLSYLCKFRRLPTRENWIHTSLKYYAVETGCPVSIDARKSHQIFLPAETVETILAKAYEPKLMACAQDALWKNVYSRPYEWQAPEPN